MALFEPGYSPDVFPRWAPWLNADGQPFRWAEPLRIALKCAPRVPFAIREALQLAATAWANASGHRVGFVDAKGPLNYVTGDGVFVDFMPGGWSGSEHVLAHTAPRPNGGMVMLFNGQFNWHRGDPWYTPAAGKRPAMVDARLVGLHELGHVLGLGHSSDPAAVMWPVLHAAAGLGGDDVRGIRALYG